MWGKLDPRSDSPTRRSGFLANFIVITLLNIDIGTIKMFLMLYTLGLMLFLYIFLAHFITAFVTF